MFLDDTPAVFFNAVQSLLLDVICLLPRSVPSPISLHVEHHLSNEKSLILQNHDSLFTFNNPPLCCKHQKPNPYKHTAKYSVPNHSKKKNHLPGSTSINQNIPLSQNQQKPPHESTLPSPSNPQQAMCRRIWKLHNCGHSASTDVPCPDHCNQFAPEEEVIEEPCARCLEARRKEAERINGDVVAEEKRGGQA